MTQTGKSDRLRSAIIGHTGFVGGSLSVQYDFATHFNSKSIPTSRGQRFDLVVCAAAPGSMIEANLSPERDKSQIESLIGHLSDLKADRFVLISSIAVLRDFAGGYNETASEFQTEFAYGRHRRDLEAFVEQHFDEYLVVRLPALFGPGIRKNFIFDLLNPIPAMLSCGKFDLLKTSIGGDLAQWLDCLYSLDSHTNMWKLDRNALNFSPLRSSLEDAVEGLGFSSVAFHNRSSSYQYYDLSFLWSDIMKALGAGLSHIHLVSEPLKLARIYKKLTGRRMPETEARVHCEDMRTQHAALWGASGHYLTDADTTLSRLADFFSSERAAN